ncbi:MAG: hypothetical protein RL410_1158 [Actinomycetota bacterium]|jgi:hypothetical protein
MNLDAEDLKLVTLSKGARARVMAASGASVRDQDGRTYSGASVVVADRHFGALELAVATAMASGAKSLEAASVVGDAPSVEEVKQFRSVAQSGALLVLASSSGDVQSVDTE